MKMNSIRRPKNTATLSIVLSITTSCLLKLGKNRTNFKILSNLNVLSTDKPEPSAAIPCTRPVYISNELSSTITPSKTLKPSLIYRNKPYAPTEINNNNYNGLVMQYFNYSFMIRTFIERIILFTYVS